MSGSSFGSASGYAYWYRVLLHSRKLRSNRLKQLTNSVSKSQIPRTISPFQGLLSRSSIGAEKILRKRKRKLNLKTDKNGIAEFPKVTAEKFTASVVVKR